MINQKKYQDLIIINEKGTVVYADVGDPHYFDDKEKDLKGRTLRSLYRNFPQDYPALAAARQGKPCDFFEVNLITSKGSNIIKTGCTYPLYDNENLVGAIEFSSVVYDKNNIRQIEGNLNHLIYRANNTKYLIDDIITQDPAMILIKDNIEKIALTDANVLIYGETGTGKELMAQAIHNSSRRYAKKFVSVNCGALPEGIIESLLFGTLKGSFTGAGDKAGLFEQAEGGTLFLDEINSLDSSMQMKLLKAIESKVVRRIGSLKEKKVNVRVIAATNEEPHKLMKQGQLKPDLFYRLSTIYFKLPNLTARKGDIMLLADYFRTHFNHKMNMNIEPFDDDIARLFMAYSWPGNVRELRNAVEGAFAFAEGGRITTDDIPGYIIKKVRNSSKRAGYFMDSQQSLPEKSKALEMAIIKSVFEKNQENLTAAARELGISKQLLKYKMNR